MQGGTAARDYRRLGGIGGGGGAVSLIEVLVQRVWDRRRSARRYKGRAASEKHTEGKTHRGGRRRLCHEWKCTSDTGGSQSLKGWTIYTSNESVLKKKNKKKTAIYREERSTMSQKSSANEKTRHLENLRVLRSRRARLRRNICDCHTETRVRQTAELL